MADKQDTFDRVRVSICGILGLDPARLNGLEELHVDTAAILRFVVDDLMAAAAAGRTIDVQKLKLASEALTPLLPPRPPLLDEQSRKFRGDPAKRIVELVLAAVHRAPRQGPIEVTPVSELETLRAENERLRAMLGEASQTSQVKALPAPSDDPVMEPESISDADAKLKPAAAPAAPASTPTPAVDLRATPADQAGGSAGFRVGGGVEPWRQHVSGNNSFFWGGPSNRRSW